MAQFEVMKRTHAGPKSLLDVRLAIVAVFLCTWFPHIGSLSLKPPAEEVLNTHLCPDPVLTQSSKLHGIVDPSKVVAVSLQKSSKTKDRASTYFSRFRPCTFYEDAGPLSAALLREDNGNVTLVRIRSINLNVGPWNFSGSGECSKFIMFKSWAEYGNGYPITCGRDSFDQYLGPYGHPMILYYHLKDQGISFPLFHPNVGQNYRDQKDPLELKYMLIYYSIRRNGVWTCRLQQYRLHPAHQSCPSTPETNCGEYSCPELDTLYQKKMGVVRDGEQHQQRFIIVKSKTQEKYRVRNFLRQKFVPIVFLLVLVFAYKSYMKAGLRLSDPLPLPVSDMRLRRYHQRPGHHHHHLRPYLSSSREHFRDIYFEYGGEQIPGLHIPYDPNGVNIDPTEPNPEQCPNNLPKYVGRTGLDPPPSYESLFPPTYVEATASKDPKV